MLVSKSSAMHQLRSRSAQKPQLDLIADRMPLACNGHKSLEICDRCEDGTTTSIQESRGFFGCDMDTKRMFETGTAWNFRATFVQHGRFGLSRAKC